MSLPQEKQQEIGAQTFKKISEIDSNSMVSKMNYIKSHPNTYASIIAVSYTHLTLPTTPYV